MPAKSHPNGVADAQRRRARDLYQLQILDRAIAVLDLLAESEGPLGLADVCEHTAAEAAVGLADLSDPLLDTLAQRHAERERPLFVS